MRLKGKWRPTCFNYLMSLRYLFIAKATTLDMRQSHKFLTVCPFSKVVLLQTPEMFLSKYQKSDFLFHIEALQLFQQKKKKKEKMQILEYFTTQVTNLFQTW